MSDQEQTPSADQHTDEQMQDLPVAEEQQDDVTGGAARVGKKRGNLGDSAAQD